MGLDSIEVTANYSQKMSNHTLRVIVTGRPGGEPHIQILTTGNGHVGDAIIDIGELEQATLLLKDVRDDFVSRFKFTEQNA